MAIPDGSLPVRRETWQKIDALHDEIEALIRTEVDRNDRMFPCANDLWKQVRDAQVEQLRMPAKYRALMGGPEHA